ncbi:MAG: TatD family hydrolase [Aeropyrum sp.]|nr:TatD family hydrolase [Aeropyrum sp.]
MIPVGDAHTHANPVRGMGARMAARRFKRSGGWFAALLNLTSWSYGLTPSSLDSYRRMYEIHLAECKAAREEGLRVSCFAGIHPAEVDRMIDKGGLKPEEALELGLKVVGLLEEMCREGVVDGVGEVGRQHYKTSPLRVAIAMAIAEEAARVAADHGCLLQLHLENEGPATVDTTARLLERAGLTGPKAKLVIFHHATLKTARRAVEKGYNATIPGVPRLLDHAARTEPPDYMVESDYIDDPARPGVVVEPWRMAEKLQRLAEEGLEEWAYRVSVDLIARTFHTPPP